MKSAIREIPIPRSTVWEPVFKRRITAASLFIVNKSLDTSSHGTCSTDVPKTQTSQSITPHHWNKVATIIT